MTAATMICTGSTEARSRKGKDGHAASQLDGSCSPVDALAIADIAVSAPSPGIHLPRFNCHHRVFSTRCYADDRLALHMVPLRSIPIG